MEVSRFNKQVILNKNDNTNKNKTQQILQVRDIKKKQSSNKLYKLL